MNQLKKIIKELFNFTFNNPENKLQLLEIGIIEEELAAQIATIIGFDTTGYTISIDNYGILHTMKRHGNEEEELKRHQVAVTQSDFELIPEIIFQADDMQDGNIKKGKRTIIFVKKYFHLYFVHFEIRIVSSKKKKHIKKTGSFFTHSISKKSKPHKIKLMRL